MNLFFPHQVCVQWRRLPFPLSNSYYFRIVFHIGFPFMGSSTSSPPHFCLAPLFALFTKRPQRYKKKLEPPSPQFQLFVPFLFSHIFPQAKQPARHIRCRHSLLATVAEPVINQKSKFLGTRRGFPLLARRNSLLSLCNDIAANIFFR